MEVKFHVMVYQINLQCSQLSFDSHSLSVLIPVLLLQHLSNNVHGQCRFCWSILLSADYFDNHLGNWVPGHDSAFYSLDPISQVPNKVSEGVTNKRSTRVVRLGLDLVLLDLGLLIRHARSPLHHLNHQNKTVPL